VRLPSVLFCTPKRTKLYPVAVGDECWCSAKKLCSTMISMQGLFRPSWGALCYTSRHPHTSSASLEPFSASRALRALEPKPWEAWGNGKAWRQDRLVEGVRQPAADDEMIIMSDDAYPPAGGMWQAAPAAGMVAARQRTSTCSACQTAATRCARWDDAAKRRLELGSASASGRRSPATSWTSCCRPVWRLSCCPRACPPEHLFAWRLRCCELIACVDGRDMWQREGVAAPKGL
jgi:hypothetical protein